MKTRSISSIPVLSMSSSPLQYSFTACNGQTAIGSYTGVDTQLYLGHLTEAISGTNGRKRSNPVVHRKRTKKINSSPGPYIYPTTLSIDGIGRNGITTYGSAPGWNAEDNVSLVNGVSAWDVLSNEGRSGSPMRWSLDASAINESKLIEDCYEKARGLKSDVLLNIMEANQLWPAAKSIIRTLPLLRERWTTIRKLVRVASGSYLAYKFGISPFLSDMSDLYRYIPKIKDDLKKHRDGQKSRYIAKVSIPTTFDDGLVDRRSLGGYVVERSTYQGRIEKQPTIRYVLVVEPRVSFYTDAFNGADRLMSRLATGPASLAWEKVPWSFVADWFVDLRGWLRYVDDAITAPPYKVISFTRSSSYVVNTDVFNTKYSPCNGATVYSTTAGSVRFQEYVRSVVPLGYSSPTWNVRFGKSQAAITAALIGQFLTTSKRR